MIQTQILKPNVRIFILMSFSAALFLLAFYIFQINSLISSNYWLKSQQKNLLKLSQENESLAANLAGSGSLLSAEVKIAELGFEKIGKIHYIQASVGQVATVK
jgi:hypothetical protein